MRSLLIMALATTACSGAEDEMKLDGWVGGMAHLRLEGLLDGEPLAIDLPAEVAGDTEQIACERDYEVPLVNGEPDYAGGSLVDVSVSGLLEVNGELRYFELELKEHDFQNTVLGTELTIVPRFESRDPEPTEMWLEWEWHNPDQSMRLLEASAQSGTFELKAFDGVPSADGLTMEAGTGMVGGYFDAYWSPTENVRGSFTVNCTENEVETVE